MDVLNSAVVICRSICASSMDEVGLSQHVVQGISAATMPRPVHLHSFMKRLMECDASMVRKRAKLGKSGFLLCLE
ncbi:MAG: hypothetical protein D6690_02990 [Nitrospirae bacterium]|nr:MAG: hypothetical protein D6690_02990 [Nitrospirota bacterium]